jgi:phosphotriesterase-related protein
MRASAPSVLGEVALDELGPVLSHEHVFLNLMRERRGDGLLADESRAVEELSVFRDQGGSAIIDLTAAELTPGSVPDASPTFDAQSPGQTREPRSVEALRRVSRASGVHIFLATGRYRDPYLHRPLIDRLGVDGLAAEMVRDLTEGFGDTVVRAALIGEIGSDAWYISAAEERVFRAAAAAHHRTGAAIYTHAARWEVGLAQLDLLEACGVEPQHVAVGHVDTVPSAEYALRVAQRGAYVGLDTIYSKARGEWALERLLDLVQAGFADQVLLSHDVCVTSQLRSAGGPGYGYILGSLRRAALARDLPGERFDEIVTVNPRRLLSGLNTA